MTGQSLPPKDLLNNLGHSILALDTRWMVLTILGVVCVFCIVLRVVQGRFPSRGEAQDLAVVLLQLYTAPVLLAMLVLTDPPAVTQVDRLIRQGAGLLASIFFVTGVGVQVLTIWSGSKSKAGSVQQHEGGSAH